IAANALVIFFFGRLVEDYVGSKRFAGLFLISGVIAGLSQIGVAIFNGNLQAGVLGASGAGLAIMGVLTILNPNLRVYLYFILPVPLWLLTLGYAALSAFAFLGGGYGMGGIAHAAHLVGLIIGLAYGKHVEGERRVPDTLQFGGGGPGGPRRRGPF
ncbi:MAG: rhomboid family intramembrane serine protease, partial [Halobacteriaceae archaeon]